MTLLHGSLEILAKITRRLGSATKSNTAIKNHKNHRGKKLIDGNRGTTQAKMLAEELLACL